MAKRRVTLPANALGPVSRQGDKARLQDKVIRDAQAKAKTASQAKPTYQRPPASAAAAQKAMIGMRAPSSSVRPSQAKSTFTPGSKADMAYVGRQAAKAAPKRRLGSGVKGALLTAAAEGAAYLYNRKDKKKGK